MEKRFKDLVMKYRSYLISVKIDDIFSRHTLPRALSAMINKLMVDEDSLDVAELIIDYSWEKLHTGHWASVDVMWRELYYVASVMSGLRCDSLKEVVHMLDMALIMGMAPPDWPVNFASSLAWKLNGIWTTEGNGGPIDDSIAFAKLTAPKPASVGVLAHPISLNCNLSSSPIPTVQSPSIETFFQSYFSNDSPVVIQDVVNHWRAYHTWSVESLTSKIGLRTVPIEIGSKYTDDDWTQKLITYDEFFKSSLLDRGENKSYLAQHQLFDQIPELMSDFVVPDYCSVGDFPEVVTNAWIGPGGTVSPLHTDDKHNMLSQIYGRKLVILCHPSSNVYPKQQGLMTNTSDVDLDRVDLEKYPGLKAVRFQEFVLKEGELLFIPRGWWHYVRSLTPSISVSFWFN